MINRWEAIALASLLIGGALLLGYWGITGAAPWPALEHSCPRYSQPPSHD